MQYFSTRNASERTSPSLALLTGLAPDGGLYVPEELPALFSAGLYSLERRELFARVISALIDDIPYERILAAVDAGYGGKFDTPAFCPVVKAGDTHILELWHGPTCAFKDMALCILPHLMNAAREKNGLKEDLVILTATSGDTGKAALAGFADAPHTKIIVFYPDGGVSELQRLQMVTQRGENVRVCAVRGNFDDAQRGVKAALEGFKHEGLVAGSANSINIGRLAPQAAYYFAAYGDMVANGTIEFGREVDFVVPTGNFGNILAGYMAKRMGLPVGKLICASNANDVLYQFLSEGVYDRASRQLIKTASPSMDILISSNLERLLFFMANRGSEAEDAALVASLMAQLKETGRYALPDDMLERIRAQFLCGRADDDAAFSAIRDMWQNSHYLMDTHTAVAYSVYAQLKAKGLITAPAVVLSTASPFKFAPAMLTALGEYANESCFDAADRLSALTGLAIPNGLSGIRELCVLHTDVVDPAEMGAYIHSVL